MEYKLASSKIDERSHNCSSSKKFPELESSWNFHTLVTILLVRILLGLIWIIGIGYAAYEVYLAAEENFHLIRPWLTVPGPFINQARDNSNDTWDVTVIDLFFKKQLYWFLGYLIFSQWSRVKCPRIWLPFSSLMALVFLQTVVGTRAALYVFCQPLVYWILMASRSKAVIWAYTVGQFILMTYEPFLEMVILEEVYEHSERADFLLICALSWTLSRCISYSMETWSRDQSLMSLFHYSVYFPLVICGPLVLYDRFEKDVETELKTDNRGIDYRRWLKLVLNIFRMLAWVGLHELASHYLHIRPLALNGYVLQNLNCWALAGIVYGLSQCFMLTVGVVFGFPSCAAKFDGIDPGGLPNCPGYVHRYSFAWRNFDKGLYKFLVRYIYIPTVQLLDQLLSGMLKKILASFTTFIFIYIWHGVSFRILAWAMLQFAEVTMETIGGQIKKRVDARYEFDPLVWDFFIEPLTSAPLAAMAILVNASFVLSPTACLNLTFQLSQNGCWLYVYFFCICFAQVGVTVRTWKSFSLFLCKAYRAKYGTTSNNMSTKMHPE